MATFRDSLNESVKAYLVKKGVDDIRDIDSVEEETHYGGGCETCSWEETVVTVRYIDTDGALKYETIWSTFGELIKELVAGWPE
ncbi:hypothetical protein A5630_25375 [Mycolicibacterium mucogenicum]|uniref:Uncharacterized protein n=1 Tax=Mycolicibacterium mucogenicum TaxID=56689 RepID=A0A1A3GWT4_MYCMU|nr:hypothetical protein [Mycolicibacterium mucogenicum]OBJ40285.1 hypothetical protein A5630_25375 [Mycolicibacterium mucogenicum]